MRKTVSLAFTAAALAMGGAAQAAPTPVIIFSPNTALPNFTTAQVFESFSNAPPTNANLYNPATQATPSPYTETVTGQVRTYVGTVPNDASTPPSATNQYLAIQGAGNGLAAGSYTVNFGSTGVQFFSFVLGSLDLYNGLTLSFEDGTSTTLMGGQIIGTAGAGLNSTTCANGNCGNAGRVSYDLGGQSAIKSVNFFSGADALEVDDLAAAVPEPATWALMIVGFGLMGTQLRRRRHSTKVSFA